MTENRKALLLLIAAAFVFLLLPILPFGFYLQWPFVILTTFIHEMGHGLTAIAAGGTFIKLELFSNASGVAWSGGVSPGFPRAAVAAGGLLAPPLVGGLFILAGRSKQSASWIFTSFSVFLLISCVLWVRTPFGVAITLLSGFLFLLIAGKTSKGVHQFIVQFFAVHMLVDTLTRTMRYLFVASTTVNGQVRHSDTGFIAQQLGGNHVLWGGLIAVISILIFYYCFRKAYLN